MNHQQLEWWAFVWSEVRLVIAAVALFIGGVPPALFLAINAPEMLGTVTAVLKICWLISGAAAVYLLYQWFSRGRELFGGRNNAKDTAAFLVMTISGINLGVVGLTGFNFGMSMSANYVVFIVAGVLYLMSAFYLYQRWSTHGQRVF
jgi:uncharacterized membrane protein YuzA (DUF378 family)